MPLLRYAQLDSTYVNAVESAVKLSSLNHVFKVIDIG